jgi:hypothetical protein
LLLPKQIDSIYWGIVLLEGYLAGYLCSSELILVYLLFWKSAANFIFGGLANN